jgi:hypothetical protein
MKADAVREVAMPKLPIPLAWGLLVLFLAAVASPARAESIIFTFEGSVATVFDGLGALGNAVEPGATFSGAYTFDSDTPNTAPPVGEGDLGLYHHEEPPAGVIIRVGPFVFRTVSAAPDFDIHVANDFGFAGTDEYGFASFNNEALGLLPSAPIGRLDLTWLAVNFNGQPFMSADLPLEPPDLDVLGGGNLVIEGECVLCAGPAAFFRIEGTLTSLDFPVRLHLSGEGLSLEGAFAYDIVRGDLTVLRDRGEFHLATDECLANNHDETWLPFTPDPDPGDGFWFLARPAIPDPGRTYDSGGRFQVSRRDASILLSGLDCP